MVRASAPLCAPMLVACTALSLCTLGCSKKDGGGADTAATPNSGDLRASWADVNANLPACAETNAGDLAYVRKVKMAYVCQGTTWTSVEKYVNDAFVVATTAVAAGDTCFYGGTKYESGMDEDGDNALDAAEAKSRILVCEASVDAVARATFKNALPSLAFVTPYYSHSSCSGQYSISSFKPLGFVASSDSVVIESGFPPPTLLSDCDGNAGNETMTLSGADIYLPKTTLDADAIWERGFAGEIGNATEFDTVEATARDNTLIGLGATAVSPYHFFSADFTTVGARTALPISTIDPTVATGTSLIMGEQLFGFGRGNSNGFGFSGLRVRKSAVAAQDSCLTHYMNQSYDSTSAATLCTGTVYVPASSILTFLDLPQASGGSYAFQGVYFDRTGKVVGTTSGRNLNTSNDNHPFLLPARDLARAISAVARSWTAY
jgi:hypothetical protein